MSEEAVARDRRQGAHTLEHNEPCRVVTYTPHDLVARRARFVRLFENSSVPDLCSILIFIISHLRSYDLR